MLYSQEELPETVIRSLLSAPHARKIFTRAYKRGLNLSIDTQDPHTYRTREKNAMEAGWRAVKEAYGLAY